MKILQILIAVSILSLSACASRHKAMEPEMAAKEQQYMANKQEMMQQMQDMCAQREAALSATKNEVDAALKSKNSKQMIAALAKASDELQQVEEHLQMNCAHMKVMGEKHAQCMHDGKSCGCGHHESEGGHK